MAKTYANEHPRYKKKDDKKAVKVAKLTADDKLSLKRFGKLYNELTSEEQNALYYFENI